MLDPDINIAFIGGGNMAQAIIAGLIKQGHKRDKILVCAPSIETREKLSSEYHIRVERENSKAAAFADVIILAVKPNLIGEVCIELSDAMEQLQKYQLVISIAAGVKRDYISDYLNGSSRVVCAMPNLPAAICKGLIGMHTHQSCDVRDVTMAEQIMQAVGETVWVEDESQMPAIVATAGSSPAYFFLFMESMEKAAVEQGLDPHVAKTSVLQSALGAVSMAVQSNQSLSELRRQVTSPKGSTERAVEALLDGDIGDVVSDAMQSAANRVDELYELH